MSAAWVKTAPAKVFAVAVDDFCCKTFPASEAVFADDFSFLAIDSSIGLAAASAAAWGRIRANFTSSNATRFQSFRFRFAGLNRLCLADNIVV